MTYDAGLVARVEDALRAMRELNIRQKAMFGRRGFMRGKSAFLIVRDDGLVVKVPKSEYVELLQQSGIAPFAPGGDKPMGTWVEVASEVVADDPELHDWIRRGLGGIS